MQRVRAGWGYWPSEMEWMRFAICWLGLVQLVLGVLLRRTFGSQIAQTNAVISVRRARKRDERREKRRTKGDVIEVEPLGECVTNVPRLGPQGGRVRFPD